MKKNLLLPVIAILVIFMSGCPMFDDGGDDEGEIPVDGGGGGRTPANNNKVQLTNYSNAVITELYISPVYSDDWGYNQLYDYVYPGEYYTVTDIPDACYDLQVVNEYGYYAILEEVCLYDNQYFFWDIYDPKKSKDFSGAPCLDFKVSVGDGAEIEGDDQGFSYKPGNENNHK